MDTIENDGNIVATVGIPMYKSAAYGFLPLEGLARQKNAPPWELIVVEEQDSESFGENRVMEYRTRLEAAGCKKITYYPLDKWTPLPQKWRIMGKLANPSSKIFCLEGSDDISGTHRLFYAHSVADKSDMSRESCGYFYDITTGVLVEYNRLDDDPGIFKNIRTQYMRNLPVSDKTYSVDGWIFSEVEKQRPQMRGVSRVNIPSSGGVCTKGYNRISKAMPAQMKDAVPPFWKTDKKLCDILDADFCDKISSIAKNICNMYGCIIFYNDTPAFLERAIKSVKACGMPVIAIDGAYHDFPHPKGIYRSEGGCIDVAQALADYYIPSPPWGWLDQAQKRSAYMHCIPYGSYVFAIDADEELRPCEINFRALVEPHYRVMSYPENFSTARIYRTEPGIRYLYQHSRIIDMTKHAYGDYNSGAIIYEGSPSCRTNPFLLDTLGNKVALNHYGQTRLESRNKDKKTYYASRKEAAFYKSPDTADAPIMTTTDTNHASAVPAVESPKYDKKDHCNAAHSRSVRGAMATHPARIGYVRIAMKTILPQIADLHVCCNQYTYVPPRIKIMKNVKPVIPMKDYGSIGRFLFLTGFDGYYFMFDDDILYPKDYVQYMTSKIDEFDRKAIVTLHGRDTTITHDNWYENITKSYKCLETVERDVECHIGGTGVMAFHTDTLQVSVSDFTATNFDDVEFSILCQKKKIPIIVAAHQKGYINAAGDTGVGSIWSMTKNDPMMKLELSRLTKSIQWQHWRLLKGK